MPVPEVTRQLLIDPRPSEFRAQTIITADLIDAYDHVNNARYLDIYERHRGLYVKALGMSLEELGARDFQPVLADGLIKYKKPLFLGDVVEVRTVAQNFRSAIVFNQEIYRGDELASYFDSIVGITIQGRVTRVPEDLGRMISQARFL